METLVNLSTRRSIRKYEEKPVSDDTLEKILKAAMDAPSAFDEQPWHFLVIREQERLKQIPQHHNHSDLVADAAAAILVCTDTTLHKMPEFWIQDCSAASQNILTAAHDLNLGAVWIGVYPTEANVNSLRVHLELPDNIIPFALIALGYPDEPYPEKENYKSERVHHEEW
ncbi:MAG: nitroreductase family protein [Opitutales bacterium]|nr:nitroreductase family protein [Opitutales bacterium]